MKALLQRVSEASVGLDGETIAEIGLGMVVLVCTERDDGEGDADFFARKIANIRLFADEDGKSNLSILDVGGEALVISQFTLAADWRKGNRPGFSRVADPETAEKHYLYFCKQLAASFFPFPPFPFPSPLSFLLPPSFPLPLFLSSNFN